MPRVYRADNTAHIRDRLKNQARYFSTGILVALLGAITTLILSAELGGAHHALTVAVWGLLIALVLTSGTGLALTAIKYLVYRRQRADLDAAGAEVIGEWYARLHRPKHNE